MTAFSETKTLTFYIVSCYTCGVRFGIESELHRRAVTDAKGSVFCPACGNGTCWRESDDQKRIKELESKLKWEMENAERQRTMRKQTEASLIATKGVVTKMRKRISAGVCPCCNRTFKQLAAHMKTQHPEFIQEADHVS